MHRIRISILGVIVVMMLLHLYSMGNKNVIPPINYSGSVKIQDYSDPINNIKGLKFPSDEDKKYIYIFIQWVFRNK